MTVTAFLTTPLFAFERAQTHAPANAVGITGDLVRVEAGGYLIRVQEFRDATGRQLDGKPVTLFVPTSKLDHVLHHEG
jgi:hypothetical protein